MRNVTLLIAAVMLVAVSTIARGADDDDCRAVILDAMKAHGGRDAINKYRNVELKYKGTFTIGGASAKAEGEIFINYPERMKHLVSLAIGNETIRVTQVFDGKQAWMNVGAMNMEIKGKDSVAEVKQTLYAEQLSALVGLDGKEFKFASLGDARINDHDAVGIRVSKEGKRDVNLWIDKKTHWLVKSEFRGKEPPFFQGPEINLERYVSEYRMNMGLLMPARIEVHYDGKKAVELEIVEVRAHERLDDSHFAKP
jgi:outer membrane lipoprotein-sorting protein